MVASAIPQNLVVKRETMPTQPCLWFFYHPAFAWLNKIQKKGDPLDLLKKQNNMLMP